LEQGTLLQFSVQIHIKRVLQLQASTVTYKDTITNTYAAPRVKYIMTSSN
jgi:hypothetical protein